jgi:hypothetical protein
MSVIRPLTIDHTQVSGTHTDFTVSFFGTHYDLRTIANGGRVANSNGYDIGFFSDSACTISLKWETVLYNATTGKYFYKIKIPSGVNSTTDKVFYLRYGDATIITDQSDKVNTYDSSTKLVMGLGNGTSLSLSDSTSTPITAINNGATATSGFINGAALLVAASSQYIELTNPTKLQITTQIEFSFWINFTSFSGGIQNILCKYYDGSTENYIRLNGSLLEVGNFNAGGDHNTSYSGLSTATDYFIQGYYDGTNWKVDVNGINVASTVESGITSNANQWVLGAGSYGAWGRFLDAKIAEVKISNAARSTGWHLTEYNNIVSQLTFLSIGSPITESSVGSGYLVQPVVVDSIGGTGILTIYGVKAGSTILVQYSGTIDLDSAVCSGSIGGSYTFINKSRDNYNESVNQFYKYNHAGGDETITCTGIASSVVLAIMEIGGLDNTSDPLMASGGSVLTDPSTASLTFSDPAFLTTFWYNENANDYISLVGVDTIGAHATGGNYNLQAYKRRVAAGTISVGLDVGGTANNVMVCAAWRVAPTGSFFNPIGPPLFLNRGTYPGTGSFASINLGAGESVIIASNANWSQDVTAISDGGSNTLTKIAGGTLNNSRTLSFWLLENAVANASCVFSLTYSGGSAWSFAYLQRFSGAIVSPFDAWAEGNVTGNVTVTTNLRTLTTTVADTVLFSLVADEDPGDAGQNPPTRFHHLISDTGISPDPPVGSFDYKILSSTVSAQTISATGTNSTYSKRILVVALELAVGANTVIIKSVIGVQSMTGIQSITF